MYHVFVPSRLHIERYMYGITFKSKTSISRWAKKNHFTEYLVYDKSNRILTYMTLDSYLDSKFHMCFTLRLPEGMVL